MANTVYFNGDVLTIPGAYSSIDVSALQVKSEGDGNKVVAILGECTGGKPQAVQFFSDPVAAKKTLKSGELLKACEKAWNPVSGSKEGVALGGANIIATIRTNNATKSTLIVDGDGTPDSMYPNDHQIVFQSKDWGKDTAHQIKINEGTVPNTRSVVIYDQTNDVYENWGNLGQLFSIIYTGTKAKATLSVVKGADEFLHLITKVGDADNSMTEDINITLDANKYKNMRILINDLQSYENYTVKAATRYNMKLKVSDLDLVDDASIKGTSTFTAYNVVATFADIASTLATNSRLVEVKQYNKFMASKRVPTSGSTYMFMTGGMEGISPSSWIQFFDMLSNYDISYIVPLTGDESIHAELLEHVINMSGTMGRERRAVVGGNYGESVEDTVRRAHQLNHARIQVVHGGFYDIAANNQLELYPPYILAAQHAGRAAFLEDGEAATHDVYRMSAPEYILERSDITQLLQSGCLAFEFVLADNGSQASYVRLVQDITTDLINTDVVHVERATGQLADSLNKEIRKGLDSLLTGKRTSLTDLTSAKNRVISILQNRYRNGYILGYKDVYVTKTGTVTTVDYGVAAAEPNNFTLITAHYYSETLVAE